MNLIIQYNETQRERFLRTGDLSRVPPPYDSLNRLQLTPVTLSAGRSGGWKDDSG